MSCLLEILNDEEVPVGRRIEAAQALLAFESPPEAADVARQYLLQVFEDKEVDIDLRMEALQVSRKYESFVRCKAVAAKAKLEPINCKIEKTTALI